MPEEVAGRAPLRPRERVLSAAAGRDGTWLLGTRDALLVVPAEVPATRIPWERVERADWDREQGRLVVTEVGVFGQVRPRYRVDLDEPGQLLAMVRERVTASVVLQRRVPVDGQRGGLAVIARRPPHGRGELLWSFDLDPGLDPEDPAVLAAQQRGLAEAEAELGL